MIYHVTCNLLIFIDKRSHASSEYQSHHIIYFLWMFVVELFPWLFFKIWIWFKWWKAWVIFSLSWVGLKMWQLRVCNWIKLALFSSFLTRTSEFYISVCENIFIMISSSFWRRNQFHYIALISFIYLWYLMSLCMYENNNSNLVDSASSIRLSQRLSHACLSINKSILWNCEWLIISVIVYLMVFATWITVVILELIHA